MNIVGVAWSPSPDSRRKPLTRYTESFGRPARAVCSLLLVIGGACVGDADDNEHWSHASPCPCSCRATRTPCHTDTTPTSLLCLPASSLAAVSCVSLTAVDANLESRLKMRLGSTPLRPFVRIFGVSSFSVWTSSRTRSRESSDIYLVTGVSDAPLVYEAREDVHSPICSACARERARLRPDSLEQRTSKITSLKPACMRAVGLLSSYPRKFSQSTTVATQSSAKAPSVSRPSSRICSTRGAGNALPLVSMMIRSGLCVCWISSSACLRRPMRTQHLWRKPHEKGGARERDRRTRSHW